MRYFKNLKRDLIRNKDGATLMEFGLVVGPLMMLLLGIMDLGYQAYLDTLAKSKLHEVARDASTGEMTVPEIETAIEDGLDALTLKDATVNVTVKSYFDFTNVGKPEKLTVDGNKNDALDPGDCFIDNNKNGIFDTDYGIPGTGGPDDIVSYQIEITTKRLFPLAKMFGWSETMKSSNSTAVRNQPYGAQADLVETCEPTL